MDTLTPEHQQIVQAIQHLPTEVLPELANFIEYLRYKITRSASSEKNLEAPSGSTFLLSIAGLGASVEDDLSERDEEILASEINSIHGWSLKSDQSV
jgi:hypothetical protein